MNENIDIQKVCVELMSSILLMIGNGDYERARLELQRMELMIQEIEQSKDKDAGQMTSPAACE